MAFHVSRWRLRLLFASDPEPLQSTEDPPFADKHRLFSDKTALERARQRVGGKRPETTELAVAAPPPSQYLDQIAVKDGTRVYIVRVEKLDYAEAQDDYVALRTEGKKHLKQQTISSLETVLDPSRFLRIHRSYIVNWEKLLKVEPYSKEPRRRTKQSSTTTNESSWVSTIGCLPGSKELSRSQHFLARR